MFSITNVKLLENIIKWWSKNGEKNVAQEKGNLQQFNLCS